jgi:hypothetical protein
MMRLLFVVHRLDLSGHGLVVQVLILASTISAAVRKNGGCWFAEGKKGPSIDSR